ncbi:MAG: hypothetical protein MJA82_07300 [Clostridia bacterium]|nr:hypothetical protein [Clostridia bacterium]
MDSIEKPIGWTAIGKTGVLLKEDIRDQFTIKLQYCEGKKLGNLVGRLTLDRDNLYITLNSILKWII